MHEYITSQGDMWDIISFRVYGSEMFLHQLIDANPQYRGIAVFPANCRLNVPKLKAAQKTQKATAPVWRKS